MAADNRIERMIREQIIARGIQDARVIQAFREVPRERFVEGALKEQAYADYPLPIGYGQTISQPYIVALMLSALSLQGNERVLEIGAGSGFQTALLAKLAKKVYSIERVHGLVIFAKRMIDQLEIHNAIIKLGDGSIGWKEEAPFDRIIVSAGAPDMVKQLHIQLVEGGKMLIPIGEEEQQELKLFIKTSAGISEQNLGACRFVKLIGKYGWK